MNVARVVLLRRANKGSTKMKQLLVAAVVALLGVCGLLVYQMRSEPQDASPAAEPSSAPDLQNGIAVQARGELVMRNEIDRVIRQEVEPLTAYGASEAKVEAYIAQLEARARAKGKVTALEVEPAMAAIEALEDEIGPERVMEKLSAVNRRMGELSARLEGRSLEPPPPADLDRLAMQIARSDGEDVRQRLIRSYLEAAEELESDQQMVRMKQLDQLLGTDR
jgi:hypothetical protein